MSARPDAQELHSWLGRQLKRQRDVRWLMHCMKREEKKAFNNPTICNLRP